MNVGRSLASIFQQSNIILYLHDVECGYTISIDHNNICYETIQSATMSETGTEKDRNLYAYFNSIGYHSQCNNVILFAVTIGGMDSHFILTCAWSLKKNCFCDQRGHFGIGFVLIGDFP